MTARQIPLDFPYPVSLRHEDFVVTPTNAEAYALVTQDIAQWNERGSCATILYGPKGCGKTHLTQIFIQQSGGGINLDDMMTKPCAELTPGTKTLAFENFDRVAGDAIAEEKLFHLFNHIKNISGALLLTTELAPSEWKIRLPDLMTRLRAAMTVAIQPPDDELLAALFRKQFADRQIKIDDKVIDYLIPRIERSPAAVIDMVEKLDRESIVQNNAEITVPFVRKLLAQEV